MICIGIDCGAKGGVSVLEDGKFIDGFRMPLIAQGKLKLVDTLKLDDMVHRITGSFGQIIIELVHAMPKQGVASSFRFGQATGAVEGWAMSTAVPVAWVSPAKWKRDLKLSSDKRASMDLARLTFGADKRWDVLANDGIAEAALIGYWWHVNHGRK